MFVEEFHPDFLYDDIFYHHISKNLTDAGILTINLVPENQNDLFNILLPLRKSFGHTYLYELKDHYNIIVFASNRSLDVTKTNSHGQSLIQSSQLLDKTEFMDSLENLPRK